MYIRKQISVPKYLLIILIVKKHLTLLFITQRTWCGYFDALRPV